MSRKVYVENAETRTFPDNSREIVFTVHLSDDDPRNVYTIKALEQKLAKGFDADAPAHTKLAIRSDV